MISNLRRLGAIAVFAFAATAALAQSSFTSPALLENPDGTFLGIGWDLKGGQPSAKPSPRATHSMAALRMLVGFYGNSGIMQWLEKSVGGSVKSDWVTNTCAIRKSGLATGIGYVGLNPVEITFPACDADSKDPAGIQIACSAQDRMKIPVPDEVKLKAAYNTAKKQKAWLCSNFRLRIGDLPCSRVNKVDAFTVKQSVADLDGDGVLDVFYLPDELSFTLPMADAAPFQAAYQATYDDKPIEYPATLDYLDEDGNVLASISWTLYICSAAPDDPYGNPADPSALCRVRSDRQHHYINLKAPGG